MKQPNGALIAWLTEAVANRDRSECWPWPFGQSGTGYPGVMYNGQDLSAATVALTLDGRVRPSKAHEVCHSCVLADGSSNRECTNPAHLRWGTRQENVRDMVSSGAHRYGVGRRFTSELWVSGVLPRGAAHHNAKLTEDDVRAIRAWRGSQSAAAEQFGVTKSCVGLIQRRRSWRWLP